MKTRLLNGHEAHDIQIAADLVRQGKLVVFPTDTVYGIGVDARQADAINLLYAAKQRSFDLGIPVLIADSAEIDTLAELPGIQRDWINTLTTQFWPGPLTLVLPRHSALPQNISPNNGIAIRLPDNTIARKLIRAAGGAIAASSANLSGEQPALSGTEAVDIFDGIVAAVLDGGPAFGGVPSTVFDCRQFPPRILRSGPISAQVLHPEAEQLR